MNPFLRHSNRRVILQFSFIPSIRLTGRAERQRRLAIGEPAIVNASVMPALASKTLPKVQPVKFGAYRF